MKKALLALCTLALSPGCANLAESVVDHAVDATGNVAGSAVSKAGDRATDKALDAAENSGKHEAQAQAAAAERNVSRMDPDDVLVKDGETYVVGKVMGQPDGSGQANVLLIGDGRKVQTREFVKVRAASKTELQLGADVYYTQDDDVRRGRWAKGSVTDNKKMSSNKVDVGPARDLDTAAQVAVPR